MLTSSQEKFLQGRIHSNRRWTRGIFALFLIWYIAWVGLTFIEPYVANPWHYYNLDTSSYTMISKVKQLASTATFVITLFFFLGLLVLAKWKDLIDNEKRYIEIIQHLKAISEQHSQQHNATETTSSQETYPANSLEEKLAQYYAESTGRTIRKAKVN